MENSVVYYNLIQSKKIKSAGPFLLLVLMKCLFYVVLIFFGAKMDILPFLKSYLSLGIVECFLKFLTHFENCWMCHQNCNFVS